MTQPRLPSGAPAHTGGQWTETVRPVADAPLMIPDPEVLLREARRIAYALALRYPNVDPSDLTSDAILAYVAAARRVQGDLDGGDPPRMLTEATAALAYINKVMKAAALEAKFGRHSSPDYRAMRIFKARVVEFENENGRTMTDAEKSALADGIRASDDFVPRRRPTPNFWRPTPRTIPVENLPEDVHVDEPSGRFEPGSNLDVLDHEVAAGANRRDLVQRVWPALAAAHCAPGPRPWLPAASVERHLSRLRDTGGVAAAIRAWDSAEDEHPALGIVFGPFATRNGTERDAVIETLRSAGSYGDDLFAAVARSAVTHKNGAAA